MNTQIQRGLVEIAKPPLSEWQARAEEEGDFGHPALCRHPSNHTEIKKNINVKSGRLAQVLSCFCADCATTEGAGDDEHTNSERLG